MPERTAIAAAVQIGPEVTPGTAVAANKLFNSIGFEPGIAVDMSRFRPIGQKFDSSVVLNKEWTEFDITGVGNYSELIYLLAGVLVDTTPTTVETTGRRWTFAPNSRSADTVRTYTIEQGDAVRAHKFAYGLITELGINISRDGIEIEGSGIGQRITDAITMTATPTALPEVPMLPGEVSVYLDPTSGALGTTKLLRALEANITIGDRFNPLWVLNAAIPSFAAHVETAPDVTVELLVEADAQGMALLNTMRASGTHFIRVESISPVLAGATTQFYDFRFDMAGKIDDVSPFEDEDGVYAVTWTNRAVHDATWGKALEARVTNKAAAL
jgi:hypothetical protein